MREVCFILVGDKILRVYFGSGTSIPDSANAGKSSGIIAPKSPRSLIRIPAISSISPAKI